jgi:hypothetical protein
MNVREAALFLMLCENQVQHLAATGELPATKNDKGQWQFRKQDVAQWKHDRAKRPSKAGMKWRNGMVLTGRQWRCASCGVVNQRDLNKHCKGCGGPLATRKRMRR